MKDEYDFSKGKMIKQGVLTDKDIKELISSGLKVVDLDPVEEESAIQPASIDLRLGNILFKYDIENYVLGEEIEKHRVKEESFEEYTLKNGKTVYIGLYEKINIPQNTIGLVMPRSSITRLGISITPIYMNPGYSGQMPLTIVNNSGSNIILKPMIRVAQLILLYLSGSPHKTYGGKYSDETISYSKLHMDEEIVRKALDTVIQRESPHLFEKIKEKTKGESE